MQTYFIQLGLAFGLAMIPVFCIKIVVALIKAAASD